MKNRKRSVGAVRDIAVLISVMALSVMALSVMALSVMALGACKSKRQDRSSEKKLRVFVSIQPQAFLVRRLGGEAVHVKVLVGPGQSPATYEPSVRQMAELARSHLLFLVGVPFERSLAGKLKRMKGGFRLVDTSQGITLRHDHHDPDHGSGVKGAPDPHIWLDPRRAVIMARTVARAMEKSDPTHRELFRRNLKRLVAELEQLDRQVASELAPVKGKELLVSHGAFGYFCERYGLKQVSISEGGKEPGARGLGRFIEFAKKRGARAIFVQQQFSKQQAAAVAAALDVRVRTIDPLSADYTANLKKVARTIREALQ